MDQPQHPKSPNMLSAQGVPMNPAAIPSSTQPVFSPPPISATAGPSSAHQQPPLLPNPDAPLSSNVTVGNQNERKLYIGNLDTRANETTLTQLFSTTGDVLAVKIIRDKHSGAHNTNYGFVEYREKRSAEAALQQFQGQRVLSTEIRINWAIQSHTPEETNNNHHIFVGDLANDVTDQVLARAFGPFGSLSEARVMWDHTTGKSRGFGFVAFRERSDAEKAIAGMNGQLVGSRQIRCNWANQKQHDKQAQRSKQSSIANLAPSGMAPTFETIAAQSPGFNTTVYVGNVAPNTTDSQIGRLFEPYGYVHTVKFLIEKGFAFVKLGNHDQAAMAILNLNGAMLNGRQIKCSWGRERAPDQQPYYPPPTQGGYHYATHPPIPVYPYDQFQASYRPPPSHAAGHPVSAPSTQSMHPPSPGGAYWGDVPVPPHAQGSIMQAAADAQSHQQQQQQHPQTQQ